VANPDGTGRRQLTSGPDSDNQATFSPDGTLLAYESLLAKGDGQSMVVMAPDGQGRVVVAEGLANIGDPVWAPDSRRLVYMKAGGSGALVVVATRDGHKRILGGTQRRLSTDPSWSPDGRWVAFSRQRGPFQGSDLYLVAGDGTELHRIARGRDISRATWSPDGRHIAYLRAVAPVHGDDRWAVVIAARDGSRPRRLGVASEDSVLLWSPDSSRVLWSTFFERLIVAAATGRGHPSLVTTGEAPDWR
jgi:TolB protein